MVLQGETIARRQGHATEVGSNAHARVLTSTACTARSPLEARTNDIRRPLPCLSCSRPAKVHLAAFRAFVDCDWSATATFDRNGVYIMNPVFDLRHRALHGERVEV